MPLRPYDMGPNTVLAACTGPDAGLTSVKRSRAHLTLDDDIDYIDTADEEEDDNSLTTDQVKSQVKQENDFLIRYQQQFKQKPYSLTKSSPIKSDQNANKTIGNTSPIDNGVRPRKLSKNDTTIRAPVAAGESTKIHQLKTQAISGGKVNIIVSMISTTQSVPKNQHITPATTTTTASTMVMDNARSSPDALNKNSTNERSKENISPNDNARYTQNGMTNGSTKHANDDLMTASTILNSNTITITSPDEYAGISNWKRESDDAYGMSVSLYEKNYITQQSTGSPIADCFGLVMRGNSVAMALADGVNWGEGACLAARSAVQGSLEYLDKAVFGQVAGSMAKTTREIFISLLRSFWSAHACILETGGSLTTLTVAVILPLASSNHTGKSVVCCCNVGDSLGYVYSKTHGVREFTQGSHDVNSMRDMRDALGALGPCDGNNPELGNLTLSMTVVDANDIVFLTSDGISDNFDPVVGKFADPWTDDIELHRPINGESAAQSAKSKGTGGLAPKRQNRSTSAIPSTNTRKSNVNFQLQKSDTQPIRPSSVAAAVARRSKKEPAAGAGVTSPKSNHSSSDSAQTRPKFLRSHTVIEPSRHRSNKSSTMKPYRLSPTTGLPLVTGAQRHALTLLRLEDLLSYGINGTLQQTVTARKCCQLLIDFARMITSAKRNMLEQRELYYKVATVVAPPDPVTGTSSGVIKKEIEMNRVQQRAARKRVVDGPTFSLLPGKKTCFFI